MLFLEWPSNIGKQCKTIKKVDVVVMDLSKAFDTLNHILLIAELETYGLDSTSSSYLESCSTKRYQGTRIGNAFSDWKV